METKNAKKTHEMFDETGKAGEVFNNATMAMIDVYKKQLDTVMGFYNNMFNSTMGAMKNNWGIDLNLNPFLVSGNGFKSSLNPFFWLKSNGEHKEHISSVYEDLFRQINEFNKNWLNTFQNTFHLKQADMMAFNEKYQHLLEERWKESKAIIDSLLETYNKQMDISVQSNRKLLSEITDQMDKALKSNMEFWEGAVKTYGKTVEEEKIHKNVKKETHQHA